MLKYNLFVYGSLREGFYNFEKYLEGKVVSITPAILAGKKLYHMPYKGYPAVLEGRDIVFGEIIEVEDYENTVKAIDEMENFISDENPANEYHKTLLKVQHLKEDKQELCYVYFYNKENDEKFDSEAIYIPNGDWKDFMTNVYNK